MKSTKPVTTVKEKQTSTTVIKKEPGVHSLFNKENYNWMLIGAAVMAVGFLLMAGGGSDDPNAFNPNSVYSTVRITIAPIIILAGLVIEIFAIFRSTTKS
ncbi:MAG: DUF3098 domain-containing protein [Candidatus Dadabacteria bacterium]